MEKGPGLSKSERERLDALFSNYGTENYKWIHPETIIVRQWVRMKCMFGCGEYGHNASCPPNVPSVSECERFFGEYSNAVVFNFQKKVDKPEDRHAWTRKINTTLAKLEREVFLAGYERAFLLYMDSCCLCEECSGQRETCKVPRIARPSPESMAVDVFSTVRQWGFSIEVLPEYSETMNRFAFLMIS